MTKLSLYACVVIFQSDALENFIVQVRVVLTVILLDLINYHCLQLIRPLTKTYAIHTNKLEAVQKLCAKIITKKWDHTYDQLLHEVNWTPLSTRRKKQKVSLCYRII